MMDPHPLTVSFGVHISYHIVVLKRQNRLKVVTDKKANKMPRYR